MRKSYRYINFTQEKIIAFLDHTITVIFVSLVTLWALFGDDFRLLGGNSQNDVTFYILTLICFSIFVIEILLSCYTKSEYINSFYFYLDVISTATLLLDVGWISDSIFSSGSSGAAAAKVGTRATRLIRILRLIRLIRIVKLYKAAQMHREKKAQEKMKERLRRKAALEKIEMEKRLQQVSASQDEDGNAIVSFRKSVESIDKISRGNSVSFPASPSPLKGRTSEQFMVDEVKDGEVEGEADLLKESNVNKTLSSNINKIVIILILLIMLSVPLFDSATYLSDSYTVQAASFTFLNK